MYIFVYWLLGKDLIDWYMSVKKRTQRLESTKITKPPHNNQNGEGKPSENLKCSLVGAKVSEPGLKRFSYFPVVARKKLYILTFMGLNNG